MPKYKSGSVVTTSGVKLFAPCCLYYNTDQLIRKVQANWKLKAFHVSVQVDK